MPTATSGLRSRIAARWFGSHPKGWSLHSQRPHRAIPSALLRAQTATSGLLKARLEKSPLLLQLELLRRLDSPLPNSAAGITSGPDGNIWFCDESGNSIWRCDVSTRQLTRFPLPTANAWPGEITSGADGNLWFTERPVDKVGRITPTGMITEIGNLSSPGSITTGPDHNIWFASSLAPVVGGSLRPAVSSFPTPEVPYQIRCGRGNDLLFTEPRVNRIATITTSGVVTESRAISRSAPTGITSGVGRRVWFLGSGNDRVYADVALENSMARQAARVPSIPTPSSALRLRITGN